MVVMFLYIGKAKRGVMSTGTLMRRVAIAFASDVTRYVTMSPLQFYEKVRSLPYREDPKEMEFLQRPAYTLAGLGAGGDCDDKAIVMGSFFHLNKVKFRFIAAGRNKNGPLHHTWVQAYIGNEWVDFDPTYAWNAAGVRIGEWPLTRVIG